MDIVARAKNICLTPDKEWNVIEAEATPAPALLTGYVVPMAAIGAVAGLIGGSIISLLLGSFYRVPLMTGVVVAVFTIVMAVVSVFVVSLIINVLASNFGGQQNSQQAMKVAVYAFTPGWIAGVLNILPLLGVLTIFASLYGIYLLYLGLPRLMKCPQDKAVGYTVVVVVCAIVVSIVIGLVGTMIGLGAAVGSGMFNRRASTTNSSGSNVRFDKDSTLGKLQALGEKLEESGKKADAAAKSGDQNAQAAAAVEALGTLFGGGKRVDPLPIDQIKPFIPETFAGLAKTSSNAEKTGAIGIMVSKAEATYSDGSGKRVKLEVTDSGGVSGMIGLASWANIEEDKENDQGSERTHRVNGRMVHEKMSKRGGDNEFAVVLGDRFIVGASGNLDLNEIKTAVSSIDLGKLESMKNAGVQK